MKNGDVIREALIENTIRLIGDGGFEKATTKGIVSLGIKDPNIRLNEVYIYRFFGSKEKLYETAFVRLDTELFHAFKHGVAIVGGFDDNRKEKLESFFSMAWQFILGNEERCRCYVRYYYSIYFKGASLEAHRKLFAGMVDEMTPIFKNEAGCISTSDIHPACFFKCFYFTIFKI